MVNQAPDDQQPVTEPVIEPAHPQFGNLAGAIGAKNLLVIIIAMPFVFLVVVLGIIALFGNPNDKDVAAAGVEATTSTPSVAGNGDAIPVSTVPVGSGAGSIALDGDRLAVRMDGPDGVTVVVYDLAKGEVIARLQIGPDGLVTKGAH